MLDGAARVKDLFAEAARLEMPSLAMTDHGNVFGSYDFYKQAKAAGVNPIIGMEGYYVPIGSRFDRQPFTFGDGVGQDVGDEGMTKGKVNYTHMTLLAQDNVGLHNLFRLSSLASLEGQYRKFPRFDRELLERYGKGLIGTTGCPSGEVNRWLQVGNYDRALQAAADYRDIFGPGNFYCELMDHDLEIERRTREDLLRDRPRPRHPAARHQRPPLHPRGRRRRPRGAALRADRQDPGRPEPVPVRRPRLLPQDRRRDAPRVARAARGLRQHPADRRALLDLVQRGRQPDAPLPGARRASRRSPGWSRRSSSACTSGSRSASPTPTARRRPTSSASSARWASRATSSSSPTWSATPTRAGIRVGPGRGSAAGSVVVLRPGHHRARPDQARPALRAVPQPRAHLDARHRHGLRRAPPRRHDPLRHRALRRGAGRPDHHLQQHQGEGRDQGRRARPRLPLRHGRPPHQGDAAVGHGQGHLPRRHVRPDQRPLRRGRGVPRPLRDRARRHQGRRHRARSRGAQAAVGRPRGRRDPVQRAAARRDPDPAPRRRRRDHHPARHGGLRGARPAEDGLPRPAQPHGPRRLPRAHQGQPRRRPSCSRTSTSTPTSRRTSCSGAATPSASSSSRVAGMRSLLRLMQPTSFADIAAVGALYRPGPMGANAHNDYADRKNGRKPVVRDPPRAGRAARRDPRRDPRPARLPGAGPGDRAEGRRLLPRPGRPAPQGDGQEEEGDPRQGVRRLHAPA